MPKTSGSGCGIVIKVVDQGGWFKGCELLFLTLNEITKGGHTAREGGEGNGKTKYWRRGSE